MFEESIDFGVNVKGDLTEKDILQGVPLYHRPKDSQDGNPLSVIQGLMRYGFSREYTGSNGGNMYGPGVYNVYSLRSSNEKARGYGKYIVKSYLLGGYQNFIIFDINLAKQVYGENYWIENQIRLLFPNKIAETIINRFHGKFFMHTTHENTIFTVCPHCERLLDISNLIKKDNKYYCPHCGEEIIIYSTRTSVIAKEIVDFLGRKIASSKVRGIVYAGGHDGFCAFVRNFSDVIPFYYSEDNGKTWIKGITNELIWRAGHDTDVEATLKNTTDEKGKKEFDDVANRSINGFVITYKKNKSNYFDVAKNNLISDVWFDYCSNFDESGESEVMYNGHKYTLQKEGDNFIIIDDDMGPLCYVQDLPQNVNENAIQFNTKDIRHMVQECVEQLLNESIAVDNFDAVANVIMQFRNTDDFYFVEVIKRKKDNLNQSFNRRGPDSSSNKIYVGSYTITSAQNLIDKKQEIIDLCNKENARAYITINARSMRDTMKFVEYCKRKGMFPTREFEHAAGQHKEFNDRDHNWESERPRGKFDFDPTQPEAKKEFDDILARFNMKPLFVGQTPSGGWEYIMSDRNGKFLDLRGFEKYRPKAHTRRYSDPMVLFKGDAPMVLYSNVNN